MMTMVTYQRVINIERKSGGSGKREKGIVIHMAIIHVGEKKLKTNNILRLCIP